MIRDLFVPTKIGSYYIITQNIIGVESTPTHVLTSRINASGEIIAIEQCTKSPIGNKEKRLVPIKNTLEECPACTIHSCISSAQVIFKSFTLPFTKREQIAQVITYEVEPTLPFPLKNGVFDFIITHIDPIQNTSEVLVAALQKKYLQQHLDAFALLGKYPSIVTIDMIAVYELFCTIPYYYKYKGATILIELSLEDTKLVYIVEGVLKLIRVIPQGFTPYIEAMSNEFQITKHKAVTELIKGNASQYSARLTEIIQPFWNEIIFTINSFGSQAGQVKNSKLVLMGNGSEYKGIKKLFEKTTEITTELFKVSELLLDPHIVSSVPKLTLQKNLISLAVAMPSIEENGFNINKLQESYANNSISKQFLTINALFFITIATLLISYLFQINSFKKALSASSSQAISALVTTFGKGIQPKSTKNPVKNLQRTVAAAQTKVEEKQKFWFAFSAPAQVAFLRYLYELFTGLDHQRLGLEIEKLNIKEGTLSLKGRVKDFEALEQFDAYVKTAPLFRRITRGDLQSPSFDIDIELNPNGEDDDE